MPYLCFGNEGHLGILMQNDIASFWPSSPELVCILTRPYQYPGMCFKLVPEGGMGLSRAPHAQLGWTFFLCFLLKLYIIRRVWKSHLEKGNHLHSTLACRAILHNNSRKWTGHFWCLRTGWESRSLLRVLSQKSLMWHIWFVLSISVYWEESSRGWGGIALFEIFWVNCLWWEQWSWENCNQETEQLSTWATNVENSVGFPHLLYFPAVSKEQIHVNLPCGIARRGLKFKSAPFAAAQSH